MITSPGRKINRYYENLQDQRGRDEASNQPLIDETDVVEFFKHLGSKPPSIRRSSCVTRVISSWLAGRGRVAKASLWQSPSSSTLSPVKGSGRRLLLRASGRA